MTKIAHKLMLIINAILIKRQVYFLLKKQMADIKNKMEHVPCAKISK